MINMWWSFRVKANNVKIQVKKNEKSVNSKSFGRINKSNSKVKSPGSRRATNYYSSKI